MVSKREAIPVTPHILVSYWIAAGIEKMCVCVFASPCGPQLRDTGKREAEAHEVTEFHKRGARLENSALLTLLSEGKTEKAWNRVE